MQTTTETSGTDDAQTVERRQVDWWALESVVTERRTIVDEISDATGYFHDSEAEKLVDIAEASGMKPIGVVRAAVEKEIDLREWRVAHFEQDDDPRAYIPHNAYQYCERHRNAEAALNTVRDVLPEVNDYGHETVIDGFEQAEELLQSHARSHRAKAEAAEKHLDKCNVEAPDATDFEL